MAVFLINICKFNGCGITFPSLTDLIQHIEDTHIDYDPKVVEQKEATQPACLPLSYVLRFISENVPKESTFLSTGNAPGNAGSEMKRKLAIKHHSYSISSSNHSNTPTGSEMDEDDIPATDSEDSNDSWTTEEFSSEFIMRYGARHSGVGANGTGNHEKPFACPVPGCKKRYKNVNGIKYHSKNGHKKDGKVRKGYKCHCGKSYKTATSLKNHAMATHNTSPNDIQMMTVQQQQQQQQPLQHAQQQQQINGSFSPSQSLGSLSPSSMSNMSSNSNNNNNSINGNNVLQQFNNNMGLITTNNTSNANITTCPPLTNGLSLQQLNITSNNTNSNNNNDDDDDDNNNNNNNTISNIPISGVGAVSGVSAITSSNNSVSTTTSDFSPCPIHHQNWRPNSSYYNSNITSGATTTGPMRTLIVKTMMSNTQSRSFQPIQQTVLPTTIGISPTNSNTTGNATTPRISPTFIEHKYSANTFKEKFLANLRNNNRNNSIHRFEDGHASATSTTTTTLPLSTPIKSVATLNRGRGSTVTGVGEMCSIQLQLNENCKNAFHKKTII